MFFSNCSLKLQLHCCKIAEMKLPYSCFVPHSWLKDPSDISFRVHEQDIKAHVQCQRHQWPTTSNFYPSLIASYRRGIFLKYHEIWPYNLAGYKNTQCTGTLRKVSIPVSAAPFADYEWMTVTRLGRGSNVLWDFHSIYKAATERPQRGKFNGPGLLDVVPGVQNKRKSHDGESVIRTREIRRLLKIIPTRWRVQRRESWAPSLPCFL